MYQDSVSVVCGKELSMEFANCAVKTVWNLLGSCLWLRLVRHCLLRSRTWEYHDVRSPNRVVARSLPQNVLTCIDGDLHTHNWVSMHVSMGAAKGWIAWLLRSQVHRPIPAFRTRAHASKWKRRPLCVMASTNSHSQPPLQGYAGQSILQQQRDLRLCPGLRCSLHDTVQSHSTLPFPRRKHQLYLCRRSTVYCYMRRILRWRHRLRQRGHFDLGRLHRAMRRKKWMHWTGLVIRQ